MITSDYPFVAEDWVEVLFHGVPGHIGHPQYYPEGDPYADFLPPAIGLDHQERWRAVVVVQSGAPKGTARNGPEYVDPFLVLSGTANGSAPGSG
jgi:hypothetical protein